MYIHITDKKIKFPKTNSKKEGRDRQCKLNVVPFKIIVREYFSIRFGGGESFVDAETRIQTRVNFIERGRSLEGGTGREGGGGGTIRSGRPLLLSICPHSRRFYAPPCHTMHPHGTLYCSHSVARSPVNVFLLCVYAFSHECSCAHAFYPAYVFVGNTRTRAFVSMGRKHGPPLTPAFNDTVTSRQATQHHRCNHPPDTYPDMYTRCVTFGKCFR